MFETTTRRDATKQTVLLVEDDPVLSEIVAETLTDEGYAVLCAGHGAEALALIEDGAHPALILLDMNMPVMDGWAFAREYHRRPAPHAPILVVTAAHDWRGRVEEIGAVGVLPKPFGVDDLIDAVERHIRARV